MSEERLPCLTQGCHNTIQPATAIRTGGYCGPCAGRRDRAARDEYIRKNRKDVDLYAGITDPVELLRIIHQPPAHDPLVNLLPPPKSCEQLCAELSAHHAARMMQVAADALRNGNTELADDFGKLLAAFTDYELSPLLEVLVEFDRFWPPLAFRKAQGKIRDAIIRVMGQETTNANHALIALAWIHDEEVCQFLAESEESPPFWRKQLCVGPAQYALQAGWEIVAGKQRDLCFQTCLAVSPAAEGSQPDASLRVFDENQQLCPWCHRPLVSLVKLDLTNPRFSFLEMSGPQLDVVTCDMCTCFGEFVFGQLDERGAGSWAPENRPPKFLPKDRGTWQRSPWAGVGVCLTPRSIYHAADWCLPTRLSQIGGLPAWVQDADYPKCIRCDRTMMFLAQIDNAQFPRNEGIYYAFVCPTCRTTATTYQQT